MARKSSLTKRVWMLEALESRCMMAVDLDLFHSQISVCPVFPPADEQALIFRVAEVDPMMEPVIDPMIAAVNDRIHRMEQEAPENLPGFIVALQSNMGPTGPYNTEQALDELYAFHAQAEPGSLNPVSVTFQADPFPPEFYEWDQAANDAFTRKLNESIERVENPADQNALVVALQIASVGPNSIDTDEELTELYNRFVNPTADGQSSDSQTSNGQTSNGQDISEQPTDWYAPAKTKDLDSIDDRLFLWTTRNDRWMVGITSQRAIVYRQLDGQTWHVLDQFSAGRMHPEFYPAGDKLIIRYQLPTDNIYVVENKEMVVDMPTGAVETIGEIEAVAVPNPNIVGTKWQVSGSPLGMIANLRDEPMGQTLDFLPADLYTVRGEFTDSPDVILIHGLSTDKPLEYRTITVDLLHRQILSDEVTDAAGAGFLAKRAGDYFNILWQMENDDLNGEPGTRRTPDLPYGYFELPNLIYELPGMNFSRFPQEKVNLVWSIESIAIHQFPEAGQPLDFTIDVLVEVPGGEPLRQPFHATIPGQDEALFALEDIAQYLQSRGQSLTDLASEGTRSETSPSVASPSDQNAVRMAANMAGDVDIHAIPGSIDQPGFVDSMLREIDLRLKKAQMQLGMAKI